MIEQREQQKKEQAGPDDAAVVLPRSSRLRRFGLHALVLAAFTLITIVATWPALPQLGGYVIDKGNPLYSVWAMAWQAHALVTDPSRLFDTNIMHPFMGTLAFDELSFTEAIMAAPFYFLTGNPLFSHNLILLAAVRACGLRMWLSGAPPDRQRLGRVRCRDGARLLLLFADPPAAHDPDQHGGHTLPAVGGLQAA